MVDLRRKYRAMPSKDGLEDEGDLSLSLSGKHMFQRDGLRLWTSTAASVICTILEAAAPMFNMCTRFFNVFCVFFVASYNEEHLVCSPDIHLRNSVDGGRPLSSSEEQGDSKIFMLSVQPLPPLVLVLWLDSGATHHAVGDARILCNLRDPPAGTAVRAADGVRLLVHKIGDILTQYIKIQDVFLVLGLQENLISVRQLAKDNKIVTIFYENYAELWREGKQVGGAIADNVTFLYRLCYLTMPMGDPEAGTRYIREDAMDVGTARGTTSRSSFMQLLSLSTSTSTESKMILNMFPGATDTTYTTLVQAMAELINHPHEMRRVQAKIRAAVPGRSNDITEDHLELLHYHKRVIKEMLRLHAPVPLLVPREMDDTEFLGYDVLADSRVLVNPWAIARDPALWGSVDKFRPERFLADDDMKTTDYLLGQDLRFVPFGTGRRGCLGVGFAAPAMELALASLLYHFDWQLLAGGPPKVEMDELKGLSVRLKTTLHLIAKPWFPQ